MFLHNQAQAYDCRLYKFYNTSLLVCGQRIVIHSSLHLEFVKRNEKRLIMVLIENEAFLSELTRLFQKARTTGSVCITMKRYDGRTKPKPRPSKLATNPLPPVTEYKCLIRAQLGNRKLSTVVNAKDVNKFQLAYANLLKGNMDGLKKKDKKKVASSTKATQ